jgi:hypothetical protein
MNWCQATHLTLVQLTDAAKAGMGGIWFVNNDATLWRAPFPERVQEKLVSFQNLSVTVTNSNLDLAATIAHQHLLEEAGFPMAGETSHTFSDNTPMVAWQNKGSATKSKVTADLLQHGALHQ